MRIFHGTGARLEVHGNWRELFLEKMNALGPRTACECGPASDRTALGCQEGVGRRACRRLAKAPNGSRCCSASRRCRWRSATRSADARRVRPQTAGSRQRGTIPLFFEYWVGLRHTVRLWSRSFRIARQPPTRGKGQVFESFLLDPRGLGKVGRSPTRTMPIPTRNVTLGSNSTSTLLSALPALCALPTGVNANPWVSYVLMKGQLGIIAVPRSVEKMMA